MRLAWSWIFNDSIEWVENVTFNDKIRLKFPEMGVLFLFHITVSEFTENHFYQRWIRGDPPATNLRNRDWGACPRISKLFGGQPPNQKLLGGQKSRKKRQNI